MRVHKLDADTGVEVVTGGWPWRGNNCPVFSLAFADGVVYVAGQGTDPTGATGHNTLCAIDAGTTEVLWTARRNSGDTYVNSITVNGDYLYTAGPRIWGI